MTSRYHCDAHSSFDLISAVLIYDLFHIYLSQKCLCQLCLQRAQLLLLRGTNMKSIKCPAKLENGRRKVKGVKWENVKGEKSAFWVCLHLESRQQKTNAIIDLNLYIRFWVVFLLSGEIVDREQGVLAKSLLSIVADEFRHANGIVKSIYGSGV